MIRVMNYETRSNWSVTVGGVAENQYNIDIMGWCYGREK